MKFGITFQCVSPISLPLSYNHILQAALLAWLQDESYTTFLHDVGYQREQRSFKLYSFSQLLGKYKVDKVAKRIRFDDTITVYVSSYMEEMERYVRESLDQGRPLRLGNVLLPVIEAYMIEDEIEDCYVQAFSPITIHSTIQLPTGTKKTYFYDPREKDFSVMLRDNLIRKYEAVYHCEPADVSFLLQPLNDRSIKKEVVVYRKTIITGWSGLFYMSGSKELLKMALLAGVGARNSMGFGCLLQIEKR